MKNTFTALIFNKSTVGTAYPVNDHGAGNIWQRFLLYSGFTMILFGIRLWIINSYGNAIPFWDQWDAEAAKLYSPFLRGTLRPVDILKPHNEHHIFTTQVLNLGIFAINKTWNPLLQMVVNAALYATLFVICIKCLEKVTGKSYSPALLLFTFVIFSIPFGWENLLSGFQSQFYLVSLFSIAALWFLTTQEPLAAGWWGGIFLGILSFLSLACGILVFAASAFIGLFFYLSGIRRSSRQLMAAILPAGLFIVCYWLTPKLGVPSASFSSFFNALVQMHGWPSAGFKTAVIRNLPALLFAVAIIWQRPPAKDYSWFLFALLTLSYGQAVLIAYGRGDYCLSSRYLDLIIINILLNFACVLLLAKNLFKVNRMLVVATGSIWTIACLIALLYTARNYLPPVLESKKSLSLVEESNTKNYLVTDNFDYLKDKPDQQIPYPDPNRLAMLLALPELRNRLPMNINIPMPPATVSNSANSAFTRNTYWPCMPKLSDSVWGSYTSLGSNGEGRLSMQFASSTPTGYIAIPVTGYPAEAGMRIDIEQHGQTKQIVINHNPGFNWKTFIARVDDAPFTIHVTDSSKTNWMAVGLPQITGRFDIKTMVLLKNYIWIIIMGICLLIPGVVLAVFIRLKKQAINPK